ncbi:putative transcriptional regulator, Crp/Fnr family [Chitinophaga pinensis DSM 2588]|uniref:Transcriptional regulator, Crp/Fnr family n=2 Tax=Chitinophaga pinensis TaxID=79329 RepID=A0A979GW54_CHIPD|nr:putative transcriptional regulator, Crp/Fnr family [Chitinophaga pinensis DSM 2588]
MNAFNNYLQVNTRLKEEEIDTIISFAVSRKLRKHEFLFHEGDICRHKYFVISGLLRSFSTGSDGTEHIIKFSPENSWTLDKESYDLQIAAHTSISAVEASHILSWSKADFERLNKEIPALNEFTTQLTADNIYNSSQRLVTTLSATPEEKYLDFVKNYPALLQRLPLKMIAAYLGVSLRTLDRIRHAQLPQS